VLKQQKQQQQANPLACFEQNFRIPQIKGSFLSCKHVRDAPLEGGQEGGDERAVIDCGKFKRHFDGLEPVLGREAFRSCSIFYFITKLEKRETRPRSQERQN